MAAHARCNAGPHLVANAGAWTIAAAVRTPGQTKRSVREAQHGSLQSKWRLSCAGQRARPAADLAFGQSRANRIAGAVDEHGCDVSGFFHRQQGAVIGRSGRANPSLDANTGGAPLETVAGHEGAVGDLHIIRGGTELLSVSYEDRTLGGTGDESVRRIRLDSSQRPERAATILRVGDTGYSMQQSPDRQWIATGALSQTTLIKVDASGSAVSYAVSGELIGNAFSSSSKWLATRADGGVVLTNLTNLSRVVLNQRPASRVVHAEFSADDSRFMVVEQRSINLFDLKNDSVHGPVATVVTPEGFDSTAPDTSIGSREGETSSSIVLSKDGQWLLAAWRKYTRSSVLGRATLWDMRNPNQPREYPLDVPVAHSAAIVAQKIVVSTPDGTAYVWKLPYAHDQRPLILKGSGQSHPVQRNAFSSADGRWLATLSGDSAFVWNLAVDRVRSTRATIGPLQANAIGGSFRAWDQVRFSKSGRWLAITEKRQGEPSKAVWLARLDLPRPIMKRLPASEQDSFETVVFNELDEWLATGGAPDLSRINQHTHIRLWDLRRSDWGGSSRTLFAHENAVRDLLFANQYLISTARDRSIVKWDVSSDDPGASYSFLQPASGGNFLQDLQIARSPKEKTVLALNREGGPGAESSRLLLYLLDPASIRSTIPSVVGRTLTTSEAQRYLAP